MAEVASSTTQHLSEAIRELIEAASAEGTDVIVRTESGKTFTLRGAVTIGPDYLRFISEDQDGRSAERIVLLRALLEVSRRVTR